MNSLPSKSIKRRTIIAGLGAGLTSWTSLTRAADYPSKPIVLVAPWPTGGGSEFITRAIAPVMQRILGQPIVIDSRPGATGTIGSKFVASSAPDGYTIVLGVADSHSIFPQLMKTPPYDAKRDFTALAPIGYTPSALVAHSSIPVKNIAELTQYAKSASKPLSYGSWGVGSSAQIMMESISSTLGIKMLHVPFQGSGPMHMAVMGGHINLAILPIATILESVKAKSTNYHVIGMNTERRVAELPDLPTLTEQGISVLEPWVGVLGPAGMPPDIQAKLHDAISKAVADSEVQAKFKTVYLVSKSMSLADYQRSYASEYDRWGAVIKAAKISLD